ncbi:pilus assembly protein PilP [Desulfococcus sp.]|uniref:pilus assembly protein PilP n=1 Tax=Desulfococcus sp. TaxID=2025834 RepID=UPI003592E888
MHKKIDPNPAVYAAPEKSPAPDPQKKTVQDAQISNPSGDTASATSASVSEAAGVDSNGGDSLDSSAAHQAGEDSILNDQDLQDILSTKSDAAVEGQGKPSGYSAKNKIDPFEPLFKPMPAEKPKLPAPPEKITAPKRRLTPLEKVDLDQLKLVGIVRADSGNKALVEDASGKGYIVIHGTYLGIHSGKVVDILKDRIIVEEEDKDMLGNVRVHKREMKFQRPSGDEYHEM